jgi:hypothetical protein
MVRTPMITSSDKLKGKLGISNYYRRNLEAEMKELE